MPTNGLSIESLEVKLLAGEKKQPSGRIISESCVRSAYVGTFVPWRDQLQAIQKMPNSYLSIAVLGPPSRCPSSPLLWLGGFPY